MAKTEFSSIGVFEGPTYMENTEDGPQAVFEYGVVITVGEDEYSHPRGFRWRASAEEFLGKIEAQGSVDLTLWTLREKRMPLEQRWRLYAQREYEVSQGLRSEDDMYHGID